MILLNRLRLINWHYFIDETVEIDKITFLTGANGTGKSTIIDAMQILLTGDTAGRNFNKAASEKTGRTLSGYLRAETGETDKGDILSLRPGRFTSYIAMEFKETDEKYFTIGIVFDSYENGTESHQFFYVADRFPTHNFTNSEQLDFERRRALSNKELIQYYKTNYKDTDFKFYDSNANYQQFIKARFGNLPDKYFTLFKKAVGFTPISNIAQFITEFVCDIDYHVNIGPMQSNIEQYKLLEMQAKEMQVRLEKLESIHQAYEEFSKIRSDMALSEYIVDRANFEVYSLAYSGSVDALSKAKLEIESCKAQIAEANSSLEELKLDREQCVGRKLGLSGFSAASGLTAKKSELLNKITALTLTYEDNIAIIKDYVNRYSTSAQSFISNFQSYDLDFLDDSTINTFDHLLETADEVKLESMNINSAIESKNLTKDLLDNYQSLMSSYHSEARSLHSNLENKLYRDQSEIDSLNRELQSMKKGQKPFSSRYLELRDSVMEALRLNHKDAKVDTFCDLIDIKDSTWTKAIEAVLFNNKFNLFVDDKYYEEANKILADLSSRMNYYSVSLVDSSRLIARNFSAKAGTLAEVVETNDQGARAYSNFLLGNIKRCRTFEEARNSGNGLLPNCTGYHNFATWYLNRSHNEVNYIGTILSGDQVFSKKDQIDSLNRNFSRLAEITNFLSTVNSLEVMTTKECGGYVENIQAQKEVYKLEESVARYNEELAEGDVSAVSEIEDKIKAIDEDINSITEEKDGLLTRIGELKNECRSLEENLIPAQKQSKILAEQKLVTYDEEFVDSTCVPFFENALQNLPLNRIREDATRNYAQKQSKLRGSKDLLISLRSKYVSERHLSYDISKEDNNEEFDRELTTLSVVELPSYKEKIVAAHAKAVKEFKDDFIYKLRTSIETVKSQIEDLNIALTDVKFGRDSYRFSVIPNHDYQDYYDMITDDLLLNVGDTEDLFFKKYSNLIESLIDLITSAKGDSSSAEQKAQILQNIDKFTDYRTYLVFDLKVKSVGSDFESSLARTFKRKSGGETQTPFYISILASFAQLYRVSKSENNETTRLVIFDEAFSKMDAARIIESVGLLRSFDLQVILSTPSEKIRDLARAVDLTLVVHHYPRERRSKIDRNADIERKHTKQELNVQ